MRQSYTIKLIYLINRNTKTLKNHLLLNLIERFLLFLLKLKDKSVLKIVPLLKITRISFDHERHQLVRTLIRIPANRF